MGFETFLGKTAAICFCAIIGALVGAIGLGFLAALITPTEKDDHGVIPALVFIGAIAGAAGGVWLCAARFI